MPGRLNPTQTLGESVRLLSEGGVVEAASVYAPPDTEVRLFEDAVCIIGLACYHTWADLEANWHAAQAAMVERMSEHMRRSDPKSWDGYLALLTPDASASKKAVHDIKHDMTRVRKLVAPGQRLKVLADVRTALMPVLPISMSGVEAPRVRLGRHTAEALVARGVDQGLAQAASAAFVENRPLLEAIYRHRVSAAPGSNP